MTMLLAIAGLVGLVGSMISDDVCSVCARVRKAVRA